jgi:hypothetical protein
MYNINACLQKKSQNRIIPFSHLDLINYAEVNIRYSSRGAWAVSRQPVLNTALSQAVLRKYGFLFPSDLAAN